MLNNIKFQKGITSWNVVNKQGESIKKEDLKNENLRFIPNSVFPPSEDEIEKFNLHYCMKFLPHYHDTGKFFS
jgi:multisite-specific tRNA:(cytosine-C5)-methyltransferase